MQDRVVFNKKGTQKAFILDSKKLLDLTWNEFAKKLKINQRTLADWTREKFHMSTEAMLMIVKLTKLSIPKGHTVIKWNDHMNKISKAGGYARFVKYGRVSIEEDKRKEKWRQWWESIGQYKKPSVGFQILIKIKIPKKSKLLAEFVGVMLGDGGVNRYHTSVTLSSEEKLYILYVSNMIRNLFGVTPKVYQLKGTKAVRIAVNRKQLVDFCQDIGLVLGNKVRQQVDVPTWIKQNKTFAKECLRGLVDTDGCFYNNSYYVKGKKYSYFKIVFTNSSLPLILFVYESLSKMGIRSSVQRNRKEVRIVESKAVLKYIEKVGTNNFKHLEKIREWKKS